MFLTAPLIHNGYEFLPAGSVVELNEEGIVAGIHNGITAKDIVAYEGLLCPGFVNAHCHLELSHLKGMLPEHTGLIPFLKQVPLLRTQFTDEQIKAARHEAYQELLSNGVVAVGDIANVTDTLDLRQLDGLHFHTFIESIGFTEAHAAQRFEAAVTVFEDFAAQEPAGKMLRQSIVPHAPYSVSAALFALIDRHREGALISIHNQESAAENEYYEQKTGAVRELLSGFGIDDGFFSPSGRSSLQTYAAWLSGDHPLVLVHNTRSSPADLQYAARRFPQLSWCLCPNANLYIEDRLPDLDLFADSKMNICIGTDSLASNHRLCVLSELSTIRAHYPRLDWETLLRWGTLNGAIALDMQRQLGSLEPGKQPGILHITGLAGDRPQLERII